MSARQSQTPEEIFQKKLQWMKWLGGVVALIFMGGFAAAQYIGAFAKTDDVKEAISDFREDHEGDHDRLIKRVETIESRTREIYGEQRAATERQRLIDRRIELLLERTDNTGSRRDRRAREERIEREIRIQEERVESIETNEPR